MSGTRRRTLLATLAAPALLPAAAARAQGRFPERPITILVPFPAGGATDVQMRALAEAATRHFGQTVLVENRPGAGSTLGVAALARARPDGYVVAQMTLPGLRLPFMQRMTYDPRKDFTPIIHLTGYTFGVIVRADGPYKTWQDFVADARRRPGEVRIGNTGANGTPHLTNIDLAEREKIDVVHVPFRGEADATPAVLGGHIEASSGGTGSGPLVDEGKLRFLNFWTRQRLRRWPEVPTLLELGYDGMVITSPYGLVGPLGLDPAILAALHEGFRKALHDPQHLAALDRLDQTLEYLNSADYARNMAETIDMEERRVARLGLRQG
ncbi:tripartite tricarboxylate transporter substrate binding protein [Siccirubricoccus sp. G192]|uniref:tripartite tricarboxylate transporter substrate binding protein n=1 Tax=Siccirubricoccus sp. G192 TaxID=2849651 RepID=UPI001C2BEEC5|nr:tripartite tricarboxylate transporter substrate binding protein [Siccirubricoccus sp. G192]MBV1797915.1 tripartite tricarboxylate transporter substrate binding protein [Siccirubricoccus sp. G192]